MPLTHELATLEASGLILLASIQPEVEYLFRHALVQEAAYQSLVRTQRRKLHQVVGESLEGLYPARLASPELAPVLARHFEEAGDQPRALRYYALAGRAAAEVYANAEAIQHFGRALEIAATMTADGESIADLFLRRGRALELNAQDAEAIKNYQEMEAWAVAHRDRRAQLAAMAARATIYVKPSVEQNLPLGYDVSQRALALARELGDRPAEAKVLWNLLQYYLAAGPTEQAIENGEKALQIARQEGLHEQTAYVLTDLHKAYFMGDKPGQGLAALEEARGLWRELGVLNMLADNLASTSMMNILSCRYEKALAVSEEAQQISRAIGNLWNQSYSLYMLDVLHFDRGDVGRAIGVAEECRRLAEQAGFAEGINQMNFNLALMYAFLGALPRAFEAARLIQERANAVAGGLVTSPYVEALIVHLHLLAGQPAEAQAAFEASSIPRDLLELQQQFYLTYLFMILVQSELELARGDYQRALELIEAAIRQRSQIEMRLYFPDILAFKGRTLRAAGRAVEAQAALEAARGEAEALGSRRILWEILAELAALAAERVEHEAALPLWRQAAEVVEYIAEHAGAEQLRESFLSRPEVRDVLSHAGRPAASSGK